MAEADFLELMPHSVTIHRRLGYDDYGKPEFSTSGTQYRCRWTQQVHEIRDAAGDILVLSDTIWINSTGTMPTAEDRYTLPDGRTPEVLTVAQVHDQVGPHHVKVVFGHQRYVR